MTPDLQQQIMSVVRDAGKLSLRWFEGAERNEVSYKGETDLVTVADREVEAFLRKRLHEIMPEAGMVGEEGTDTRGSGGWHFVVDPIDGTTNFVHGLPFYSVSLALKDEKETVLGIVYAPALDWTFHAALGGGAWMSKTGEADRKLHVSKTPKLIKAVAATGFACVRARAKQDNLPIFNDAIYRLQGVRRLGSAALDLCMVADGKLDLYWEMGIQPWDIAAGILILREAGGRATDLLGGDAAETRKEVLASNALVHDEFLDVLRRSYA
ncbi:MAG TPA: inositol monophosphatase family protein [Planctomycetota bacterium]